MQQPGAPAPDGIALHDRLEAPHLIYRPAPHGYGKAILEDATELGVATETAVFKHLFARYCAEDVRFSYWRGKREHEVDLVAEAGGEPIPFEVKFRAKHTGPRELKGLIELCQAKRIARGYVVAKSLDGFATMQCLPVSAAESTPGAVTVVTQIMRIPAPLLCYWMGAAESSANAENDPHGTSDAIDPGS